ncbi:MAG TPA: glycosyltransferase family 4 protein [Candidatus Limnocylindrales bacterium]
MRAVAIVTHSYFEEDPRVRRQAEALVSAGWAVTVFSLRRPGDPAQGTIDGASVQRLNVRRHQGASLAIYLAEYASFFARVALRVPAAHARKRFDIVQVATLPDWLVFSVLPLRLLGVPVVLDLHEAMPEFFRTRFPKAGGAVVQRLLRLQERASIAAANEVITVNEALRERLVRLGVDPDRVTVVPNSPSLTRFNPALFARREFMADGTLRLVYAGALTPTYELDVVVRAFARLTARRPALPIVLDIYGRGDSAEKLRVLAAGLGLDDRIVFHGRIPVDDVPEAIARADVGLAPTRHDAFTDMSLSTKIFEYAAMDKPVLCTRLPMVERTFPTGSVFTYSPGDPESLAEALAALVDDSSARDSAVDAAAARTREMAWDTASAPYVGLIARLAHRD